MKKKLIVLLVMALILIVAAACAPEEAPEPDPNANEPDNQQEEPADVNVVKVVYDQWKDSAHATAVEQDTPADSPGMREGGKCFSCHNGYAYELNAENLEGIGILKGASCDTCHTGKGKDVMASGTVEIPLGNIEGGTGALCISCHNGRGKEPNMESAPHSSVQTDMLLAKSGAEVEGFEYDTHSHAGAENKCLACHMAADEDGIKDHTFKMTEENIENACGRCHDFDTINPPAKSDFDGDGNNEGFQDEVEGLTKLLENTINEQLEGKKFESGHGKVMFTDADGNELEAPPSEELYNAAWNLFFVRYDGSRGIHNPKYSIQLLQQSYKQLTGEDVPNAEIR